MNAVELNGKAVYIQGKATTLLCASLFYFRIPRCEWGNRMAQLKQLGYNCIDVYIPWNFHELYPGEWHFEDMHDVDAFLKLAAQHELYVIARPGPYICSEWDGGALPAWLNQQGLRLRQNDSQYLTCLFAWLDRILPIVADNEVGRNGSVVAVQLENELDFFACQDPKGYFEQLVHCAQRNDIRVPLTACAGECDVQGACGWAEKIHPTFNAYTPGRYPYLENQLRHMRASASLADTPLMITETDREHDTLKRELLSGAKLMAPYNQVGGTDVDMTNGISNWSGDPQKPYAYMASDYDFVSCITVDGRFRPDAVKGRLLGSLLATLGEDLAKAEPCPAPTRLRSAFSCAMQVMPDGRDAPLYPALKMDCGWLMGASNLGDQAAYLFFETEQGERSMMLQPGDTCILPWKLSLRNWGKEATMLWAEAELVDIQKRPEGLFITLAGSGAVCVEQDGEQRIFSGEEWQGNGVGVWCRVLNADKAAQETQALPRLTGMIPSPVRVLDCTTGRAARMEIRVHGKELARGIASMETKGQYRGDIFYEFENPSGHDILLESPADLLWVKTGKGCFARACDGSSMVVPGCDGAWQIRVQSWGHSNFDDHRQPALVMGSTKGVMSVVEIESRQDISGLWKIYPSGKYETQRNDALRGTDQIYATTIDTWSYPVLPMHAEFVRQVWFREDCDSFFLQILNEGPDVEVWLGDKRIGKRQPNNPFVDLSGAVVPGSTGTLSLVILRAEAHQATGGVMLLSGKRIRQASAFGVSAEAWARLAPSEDAEPLTLPLEAAPGEELLLSHFAPDPFHVSRMMVLEGTGVECALIAGGHVCGRVVLRTPGYPDAKGGSGRRIFLPAEWNDETVCLHVCGLTDGGVLRSIAFEEVTG